MCAFQAGASCPAVSSKRHPGPQGLWSCRSRSLLLARCLELTASALEGTGGPSQQGLSAPPGPDAHRAPLGGASRRHRPDGPGAPGRDLPASPEPSAGRAEAHGRRLRRRELLHLLFVSLRVWRGSGTAQDPETQTRVSQRLETLPPSPRGRRQAFRITKLSPSMLKVAPKSSTTSAATTTTTTTTMIIIIIEMSGAAR